MTFNCPQAERLCECIDEARRIESFERRNGETICAGPIEALRQVYELAKQLASSLFE